MTLKLENISTKFRIPFEAIEEVQIIQSWIFISERSQPRKFSCCFVLTNETFIAEKKSM